MDRSSPILADVLFFASRVRTTTASGGILRCRPTLRTVLAYVRMLVDVSPAPSVDVLEMGALAGRTRQAVARSATGTVVRAAPQERWLDQE